jgi:hypothetical protein
MRPWVGGERVKVYIALFRAINVGGNNLLPMKEPRELLERIGLQHVRSYIQSGNVVFGSTARRTLPPDPGHGRGAVRLSTRGAPAVARRVRASRCLEPVPRSGSRSRHAPCELSGGHTDRRAPRGTERAAKQWRAVLAERTHLFPARAGRDRSLPARRQRGAETRGDDDHAELALGVSGACDGERETLTVSEPSGAARWNDRHPDPEYVCGTEPNEFIFSVAERLPSEPILCLAEGVPVSRQPLLTHGLPGGFLLIYSCFALACVVGRLPLQDTSPFCGKANGGPSQLHR